MVGLERLIREPSRLALSRRRKLWVVERFIERHLRLTAALLHQSQISAVQLAVLRFLMPNQSGSSGTRTQNLMIKSHLLYQLS